MRLHPIGAVIDPAGIRIAHDHHVAGADVVAAVVLVPARHRDLENVDVLAGVDVLEQRPVLDRDRRDGARLLHVAAPVMHQFDGAGVGIEPERDVDAPDRGEDVGEDAPAARKSRHVVEQHRLVADAALIDVDDAADLLLALGAGDVLQFAVGAQLRDPGAQILALFGCRLFRGASFDCRIHVSSRIS